MTTQHPEAPSSAPSPRLTATLQLLRALCHLIVVIAVCVWGFTDWALPWPGLLTGIGFTVLAVLIWALFLSPRPVLRTDRFGLGLIELLFIGAGVGAMLGIGVPWPVATVLGIVAAVLGYIVPERLRALERAR
ncbi:MAG: YrdB family protein [Leucobacter sp.]